MKFFIVFLLILTISCENNSQTEQQKYNYPGLGLLIESYYLDYFDFPNNINDLIMYVEIYKFPENFDATISKLKKNINKIFLVKVNGSLTITLEDSTIYETALRSPCEELSYNLPFYANKVLCFDKNMHPITSDIIIDDFREGLKKIKKHYKKVEKTENTNKYLMIKFDSSEGLSLFCKDNIQLNEYDYFQEVKKYLMSFTSKYKLA